MTRGGEVDRPRVVEVARMAELERMAEERRWTELAVAAESLLAEVRGHSGLWRFRGLARYHLGDLDGAREDADEAVGLAPGDGSALRLRALVLLALGRWDDAFATAELAVGADPDGDGTLSVAALIADAVGEGALALAWSARAVESHPDSAVAWYASGVVASTERRLDDAADAFGEALLRAPHDVVALERLASIETERRSGDVVAALRGEIAVASSDAPMPKWSALPVLAVGARVASSQEEREGWAAQHRELIEARADTRPSGLVRDLLGRPVPSPQPGVVAVRKFREVPDAVVARIGLVVTAVLAVVLLAWMCTGPAPSATAPSTTCRGSALDFRGNPVDVRC